jgi:hypothetical protein
VVKPVGGAVHGVQTVEEKICGTLRIALIKPDLAEEVRRQRDIEQVVHALRLGQLLTSHRPQLAHRLLKQVASGRSKRRLSSGLTSWQ